MIPNDNQMVPNDYQMIPNDNQMVLNDYQMIPNAGASIFNFPGETTSGFIEVKIGWSS